MKKFKIILSIINDFYTDIKVYLLSSYQKAKTGVADKETWALNQTLAEYILPRLRRFRQLNIGYPTEITQEKWDKILNDMIIAFELVLKVDDWSWKRGKTTKYKKVQHGLALFSKYYLNLWS